MRIGKILCTLACAASVAGTPALAESLSPGARIAATAPVKRVAPAVRKESKQGDGISPIILILGGLAVVGGIILLTDGGGPNSP